MIPIASPVPVKAAFAPPPFIRSDSLSPPSSASMSPDYYDSPPSPPRSLEDQVHVAYALDDIHLAKILLLRLKGIEVTSDDDPRIAAVQDEDFDFCFVPNGRLMDDQDEKTIKEMQAREMERIEEMRRVERLRNCERKWEDEKRRMREERVAVLKRRERKRQDDEDEQRRRREEEEQRRCVRRTRAPTRQVVSYETLPCRKADRAPKEFVYSVMMPSSSPRPQNPPTPPSLPLHTRHVFPTPTFDDSASIPFTDVLKSMQGPLFPASRPASPVSRSLEALLVEIEHSDEERRKCKGKQRAQPRRTPACLACCASPVSSPTSSSSSISRTSSWLSFRGTPSSASSSTTDLTALSASPKSTTWFASRPRSWIPASSTAISASDCSSPSPLRHSCRPHNRLTSIPFTDGPLVIDLPSSSTAPRSIPISYPGRRRSTSRARAVKEGAGLLMHRVSKFVELAKGFQNAYVTAALFSVAVSYDSFEDRPILDEKAAYEAVKPVVQAKIPLRPLGARASAVDVAVFLNPALRLDGEDARLAVTPPPRYIPLTSPFPPTSPPRTVLSNPLPYPLHFKPIPAPTRSPFRFHALGAEMHTMYPSSCDPDPPSPPASSSSAHCTATAQTILAESHLSWRIRSVANPEHLRLKALHNIVWRRGVPWEGCARDTALGGGKERVVGIAFEGVGRSMLGRGAVVTGSA